MGCSWDINDCTEEYCIKITWMLRGAISHRILKDSAELKDKGVQPGANVAWLPRRKRAPGVNSSMAFLAISLPILPIIFRAPRRTWWVPATPKPRPRISVWPSAELRPVSKKRGWRLFVSSKWCAIWFSKSCRAPTLVIFGTWFQLWSSEHNLTQALGLSKLIKGSPKHGPQGLRQHGMNAWFCYTARSSYQEHVG